MMLRPRASAEPPVLEVTPLPVSKAPSVGNGPTWPRPVESEVRNVHFPVLASIPPRWYLLASPASNTARMPEDVTSHGRADCGEQGSLSEIGGDATTISGGPHAGLLFASNPVCAIFRHVWHLVCVPSGHLHE